MYSKCYLNLISVYLKVLKFPGGTCHEGGCFKRESERVKDKKLTKPEGVAHSRASVEGGEMGSVLLSRAAEV